MLDGNGLLVFLWREKFKVALYFLSSDMKKIQTKYDSIMELSKESKDFNEENTTEIKKKIEEYSTSIKDMCSKLGVSSIVDNNKDFWSSIS